MSMGCPAAGGTTDGGSMSDSAAIETSSSSFIDVSLEVGDLEVEISEGDDGGVSSGTTTGAPRRRRVFGSGRKVGSAAAGGVAYGRRL